MLSFNVLTIKPIEDAVLAAALRIKKICEQTHSDETAIAACTVLTELIKAITPSGSNLINEAMQSYDNERSGKHYAKRDINISQLFSPDILEEFQVELCHPSRHLPPTENLHHTFQAPSHEHNRKLRPVIFLCPNTLVPCAGQELDQNTLDRFRNGRLYASS